MQAEAVGVGAGNAFQSRRNGEWQIIAAKDLQLQAFNVSFPLKEVFRTREESQAYSAGVRCSRVEGTLACALRIFAVWIRHRA